MPFPDWLMDALRALEQTALGDMVRLVPNLYPILMSIHVVGIALLVGPAIAVDLRLLGVGRGLVPVTVATRCLLPIAHVGFAIVALTGLLMFVGIAVSVAASWAAPWKFGLIALAAVNILVFHKGVYRGVASWDQGRSPPLAAKIAALVSATCWLSVIFLGRFLAY